MPVTDKKKFDDLLKRMLQAKPAPVEKIKDSEKEAPEDNSCPVVT